MLTEPACKNVRCPEGKPRVRCADSGGLYLEVTEASKRWFWKYRYVGKEKRLSLGAYPSVSLRQARLDRDAARALLHAGADPVAARQDEKRTQRMRLGTTFEAVARTWHAQWKCGRSQRHAEYVLRRLEADVFPEIGTRPITEITAPRMLVVAKKIESRGALDVAKRMLQTSGQIMRYAVAHGLLERNPAADVKPGDALKQRKKRHYARLDAKDLPELLRKIEAYPGTPYTRFAMQLMVLTFVRTSELIEARWSEFDLDAAEWRIPEARMKMDTPHIVPLSRQALHVVECLQELRDRSEYLFPGERGRDSHMSNNTILGALYRMGYKGRMTGHGFRGIASTILHELGWRHDLIEIQLAHEERDEVSAAYNFATYLPERRKMMQAWADHVDGFKAPIPLLVNIVPPERNGF
ncbi:MAG: tyrosine-type recombinase/integrase [Pseudomonadota bacterium]|nr:tyrosine-type recombinase/integrase [Pseudomonadota bacterium]